MSISVQCTQCSGSFQVADKYAGSKIRCPKCKVGVIQVATSQSSWDDGEFRLKPDETIYDAAAETAKRQGSFLKSRSARRWMMRGRVWLGSAIAACGLIAAGYFLFFGFGEVDVAGPDMAPAPSMSQSAPVAGSAPSSFNPLGGGDSFVANSRGESGIEPSIAPAAMPAPFDQPSDNLPPGAVQANVRPEPGSFVPMNRGR
ncbi:hypothetical protein [Blastopirellula retiformator]|uniref:Uncharacterized protein n=1 Tax=Blastopirellula retiformator TaxID=2527970 RepID=A0A5C5UT04_9BACT|nr:hypothetical protein [Blastopirellula retiformator]TWT29541.1 hypothetical protein Enr8_50580 [Blastopirellula retiformator]